MSTMKFLSDIAVLVAKEWLLLFCNQYSGYNQDISMKKVQIYFFSLDQNKKPCKTNLIWVEEW